MESPDEIRGMTVLELRDFFKRHKVAVASIPSKHARPVKTDMIAHALTMRAEYDARSSSAKNDVHASAAPFVTPNREAVVQRNASGKAPDTPSPGPRNIFQSSSPSPAKSLEASKRASLPAFAAPPNQSALNIPKDDAAFAQPTTTPTDGARRKSVGWAASELFTPSQKANSYVNLKPTAQSGPTGNPSASKTGILAEPLSRVPKPEVGAHYVDPRAAAHLQNATPARATHQNAAYRTSPPIAPAAQMAPPIDAYVASDRGSSLGAHRENGTMRRIEFNGSEVQTVGMQPQPTSGAPSASHTLQVPDSGDTFELADTQDELGAGDLSLAESDPESHEAQAFSPYDDMTVIALRSALKTRGIAFNPRCKKAELVALLRGGDMALQSEAANGQAMRAMNGHNLLHQPDREGEMPDAREGTRASTAEDLWRLSSRLEFSLKLWIGAGMALLVALCAALYVTLFAGPVFCSTDPNSGDPPGCVPCPEFAVCVTGQAACIEGYKLVGQNCVEQRDTALASAWVTERMMQKIRLDRGLQLCGLLGSTHDGGVDVSELSQQILSEQHGLLPDWISRFSDAKRALVADRAMEMILHMNGIEKLDDDTVVRVRARSDLARRPLRCAMVSFFWRNLFEVFLLLALFALGLGIWRYVSKVRAHDAMIDRFVEAVLELLQEQRAEHDDGRAKEAFVVDTHLRDEVLGRMRNAARRASLWSSVEERLVSDSRIVKKGPLIIYGVPCFVWEWCARTTPRKRSAPTSSPHADLPLKQ
mmetsp:Transcript_3575/g.9937  ORF Transcript_3575/g.9937 Transcript_3575/m.9937 type:complete len:762 (-) Transcript_3575:1376-3661(-)